jgi:hypothetical protein
MRLWMIGLVEFFFLSFCCLLELFGPSMVGVLCLSLSIYCLSISTLRYALADWPVANYFTGFPSSLVYSWVGPMRDTGRVLETGRWVEVRLGVYFLSYLSDRLFVLFYFFIFLGVCVWDWGLSSGLCKSGILPLEPHLQSLFLLFLKQNLAV